MSQSAEQAEARIRSRYGRPSDTSAAKTKKLTITLSAVLTAIFLVWAVGFTFLRDTGPVNPQDVTFNVIDASRAEASFSVVPDVQREISCSVLAKNQYEAIVGYREVTVPADPNTDGSTPTVVTVSIQTVQLAYQGHLEACRFIG